MTDEQISDEYRVENDTCIITCRASSPVDFVISGEDPFTTATAPCGDISAPRGNLSTSAALGRSAPDEYDDPFLAGFRDCRCQILSYMQQMQQQSDTAATISNDSTRASASCDDVINYTALINDELVGCLRQHLLDAEHRLRDVASSRHQTSSTPVTWKHSANSTSEEEEDDAVTGLDEMSLHLAYSQDDSALGASFEASSLTAVDQDVIDNTGSVTDTVNVPPEVELSHNANELMRLACNNPDVGRLLDELFELMDYDDDDDDDDVIGSDVESDDGVHEMNDEIDSYVDATHSSQHTASGATDVLTT